MQSDAVRELVASVEQGRRAMKNSGGMRDKHIARIDAAVEAVKAEEKPHRFRSFYVAPWWALMGPCAVAFCGQPADAPIHQKAGK
jgi:hypothetical protein